MIKLPRREFYMARHGRTEHNAAGILSSDTTQLTDDGVEGARAAEPIFGKILEEKDLLMYVSSLGRAQHTAIMMVDRPPSHLHTEPEIRERHMGEEAGIVSYADYSARYRAAEAEGRTLPEEFAGMETIEGHATRVIAAIRKRLEDAPETRVPAFICHEGSIRRMVEAMGIQGSSFANSGIYHFEPVGDSDWTVCRTLIQGGKLHDEPMFDTRGIATQPLMGR